jgi:predicted  nucleic acid-binding Zn-ribbon protein
MNKIIKWIITILSTIAGILALFTSSKKSVEVKELKKVIKQSKKDEKNVEKKIVELETNKSTNKKEITKLKRKLTTTKKQISKMETTFENDDVDDAVKFLRKFSKSN